jgi:hypothetical protein
MEAAFEEVKQGGDQQIFTWRFFFPRIFTRLRGLLPLMLIR